MYICKVCEYKRQKQFALRYEGDLPFCECGCGERVKHKDNRFIMNHDKRIPEPEPNLCECGCGEFAKPGNRFIKGHHANGECNPMYGARGEKSPVWGRKHTEKEKNIISVANSGENNHNFGKSVPEETRQKISITMKNGSVFHHYIYDHEHPELYTTKLKRTKHNQLHGWMRKSKTSIPHINVTKENKNIFITYKKVIT